MALVSGFLYDALRSANVDQKVDLTGVKGDVALVKWMLGFVLASNAALLFKVFSP